MSLSHLLFIITVCFLEHCRKRAQGVFRSAAAFESGSVRAGLQIGGALGTGSKQMGNIFVMTSLGC